MIEPKISGVDTDWYELDERQIKEVLSEKFGKNSDISISVTEERKLVGGRGELNERRISVYHVTATVFVYKN